MENTLTYKNAGVDVNAARELVDEIAIIRRQTEAKRKLFQAFGQFSASYDLSDYQSPVILTTCDGVGTKIKLLLEYGMLKTAGQDLVAMNVNDILTANALPLMFLDYIGISKIDKPLISELITGISEALAGCDCILAGGETAEMPDLVEPDMLELSGFCVGAAEKGELLDPSTIQEGDFIVGYASDGFHANGWSLVRKIVEQNASSFSDEEIRKLLAPTRIYYRQVLQMRQQPFKVKGMAHITGGGLRENLERVLGDLGAHLILPKWENVEVQKVLSKITEEEAIHTFNMGIGWVAVIDQKDASRFIDLMPGAIPLGEVTKSGEIKVKVGT